MFYKEKKGFSKSFVTDDICSENVVNNPVYDDLKSLKNTDVQQRGSRNIIDILTIFVKSYKVLQRYISQVYCDLFLNNLVSRKLRNPRIIFTKIK
jgi:hypothetical protein